MRARVFLVHYPSANCSSANGISIRGITRKDIKVKMKTYSRRNSSYLKKAFIASNFDEMCRLCLTEDDKGLTPIIQNSKLLYQEWIQYSVDVLIEEGDGLPPNICEKCLTMVEQTYLFKKKCKASDSKLRGHLEILEMTEEERLQREKYNNESDLNKNLFMNEYQNESKCDESSAVDSGGTCEIPSKESHSDATVFEKNDKSSDQNKDEKRSDDNEKVVVENVSEKKMVIKRIERYILKGEKRDGEQEEDLTVCEVVPVDVKIRESSAVEVMETPNYLNEEVVVAESLNSTNNDKSDNRIQEIYQLWDNEEDKEEAGETIQDNNIMIVNLVLDKTSNKTEEKTPIIAKGDYLEENITTRRIYTNKNQNQVIETIPEGKRFQCPNCDEYFPESKELRKHFAENHKELADTAFCDICCKSFTCMNSLRRHMAVHTGIKPYKCKQCGRRFNQRSILKRHGLTHEKMKPFNCHICDKGYTQKINLVTHLKTHGFHDMSENFSCKYCKKSFVHQSGLSRHIKMHKGVRFLCVYCNKTFNDTSALARHVKSIHPNPI